MADEDVRWGPPVSKPGFQGTTDSPDPKAYAPRKRRRRLAAPKGGETDDTRLPARLAQAYSRDDESA